jgi:DNA-binding NarL/FixJ family response regulator
MSDGRSQILPFPPGPVGEAVPRVVSSNKLSVWTGQMSTFALDRENAMLRAQITALTTMLESHATTLLKPRSASSAIDRVVPAEVLSKVPKALPESVAFGAIGQCLTRRQREVLVTVVAGRSSKNIAADLAISQRTVENHRAAIMRRTGPR